MDYLACVSFEHCLNTLVLLQCAGLNPAVFPSKPLDFFPIGSGGVFWLCHHPPDDMLLCTYIDDFLLAASNLCLARSFVLLIACIMISKSLLLELLLVLTFSGIVISVKFICLMLLLLIVCLSKNLRESFVVNTLPAMIFNTIQARICTNGTTPLQDA